MAACRQAELLERKRQKKLRQKEQKAKEQRQEEKDAKGHIDDTPEDVTPAEQSLLLSSDSDSHSPETLLDDALFSTEPFQPAITDGDLDLEVQTAPENGYGDLSNENNFEWQAIEGNSHRHIAVAQYHGPRISRQNHLPNGFHASQNAHVPKLSVVQRHGSHKDAKPHGNGKWSRKQKLEVNGDSLRTRVQKEVMNQPDKIKKNEVLIGSILVTLGNCSCFREHHMPDERHKQDDIHCGTNRSTVKLWRPVSRSGKESNVDVIAGKGDGHNLSSDSYVRNGEIGSSSPLKEESLQPGSLNFSSQAAKAFLAKRWKEVIATDHVTLVLSPNLESPAQSESESICPVADAHSSDAKKRNISGNPPNQLANGWVVHGATAGSAKSKPRTKPEKGVKLKYIPKQRVTT
uniref:Uncharacterized protein n=2 Tax=Rhizophora mucronata TaxID=61149 RepID=A0A2P2J649_RHIMU